jgi:hypothetical protein
LRTGDWSPIWRGFAARESRFIAFFNDTPARFGETDRRPLDTTICGFVQSVVCARPLKYVFAIKRYPAMSKRKKSTPSSNYVTTIREGAIAANVFRGSTPDGHMYLYYELSRAWKTQASGREGYSKKFSERNEEALIRVVTMASRWIEEHREAADETPRSREGMERLNSGAPQAG